MKHGWKIMTIIREKKEKALVVSYAWKRRNQRLVNVCLLSKHAISRHLTKDYNRLLVEWVRQSTGATISRFCFEERNSFLFVINLALFFGDKFFCAIQKRRGVKSQPNLNGHSLPFIVQMTIILINMIRK